MSAPPCIRRPLGERLAAGFAVALCAIEVGYGVVVGNLGIVLIFSVVGFLFWRAGRQEVRSTEELLIVRNMVGHRLEWFRVLEFERQRVVPLNVQLRVVLKDGRRIPLKATYSLAFGRRASRQLDAALQELDGWLMAHRRA